MKQKKKRVTIQGRVTVWRKHRQDHQWINYTLERNRLNRMLATIKIIAKVSEKVHECGNDTKKLYNLVNNITARANNNPIPAARSELSEEFTDCFLTKITNIRDQVNKHALFTIVYRPTTTLLLEPKSEEDVVAITRKTATKSCECGPIPANILKKILSSVSTTRTSIIVNLSINIGSFEHSLKSAIVRPLLKKQGLDLATKSIGQ